jgi:hypothetical protein
MPFEKRARILLRSLSRRPGRVEVDYSIDPENLPADFLYFHAQYHETDRTLGHQQYSVLRIRGRGLFVGLNLFDSGHNHGGGDAALIDAGTASPLVLHGICGEDYFGFAWHHFGTMARARAPVSAAFGESLSVSRIDSILVWGFRGPAS